MRTVWRVAIAYEEETEKTFNLPEGYEVLELKAEHIPNRVINIWIGVDDERKLEPSVFELFPTGKEVPLHAMYLGTAIEEPRDLGNRLVLHLYQTTFA